MAYRMILNERSYFGAGAIENIPVEFKGRGLKKAVVITDKGLLKAGVVDNVTAILDKENILLKFIDKIVNKCYIDSGNYITRRGRIQM